MEQIPDNEAPGGINFDIFIWPLCTQLALSGPVWIAPNLPPVLLTGALRTYLDLATDETLLAIIGGTHDGTSSQTCALTTKRIYWRAEPSQLPTSVPPIQHPSSTPAYPPPPQCDYLSYADLPEVIALTGALTRVIDLGDGRTINLSENIRLEAALIDLLEQARSLVRGEKLVPSLSPQVVDRALQAWRPIVAANAHAKILQFEVRKLVHITKPIHQAFVTWFLAASCFIVFLAMVVRGVSPLEPAGHAMHAWGANFGPDVALNGELWRLGSSMFLHFGVIHLAMNLWCLLTAGPLVERFYGHSGFLALYILSGLGGAIASLVYHPTFLCAGASGAIFGVFGGLLAFLLVRHHDVPMVLLRQMRSSTLLFLVYNIGFGMLSTRIDMAAHLGGLISGFIAGLFLTTLSASARGTALFMRRAIAIALLIGGLVLVAQKGIALARMRLLANPLAIPHLDASPDAASLLNEFTTATHPISQGFDEITQKINPLLQSPRKADDQSKRLLAEQIARAEALRQQLNTIAVPNEEIQHLCNSLASAESHYITGLRALQQFLETQNPIHLSGGEGFSASLSAYQEDLDQFRTLRATYIQTHGLIESK
jgi:rhomboid protease GluP